MSAVRQDAATLGSGWNKTLLNYALAMNALDSLPLANRNSWKFFGAIHGFDRSLWIDAELMSATEPVPSDFTNQTFGNQCQHASWFFLPWHRGYLNAFETVVAAKVKELTGDDWALPYWNYFDEGNPDARRVPDAFLADTLPNGDPNPLARYPRRAGMTMLRPGPTDAFSLAAMEENDFIVGNDGSIGLGGGITGDFVQFARWTGDLENNPHNTVHRLVGGDGGFMADPRLAGLDPIFWLHHCNIDRLWEAWMNTPGKTMVSDARWRNGPADQKFIMPALDGTKPGANFTALDTLKGGRLHPTYDDLKKGTGVVPGAVAMSRVGMGAPDRQTVEPIGANAEAVTIGAAPTKTRVDLEPGAASAGVKSMGTTEPGKEVTRFYLALESVRGTSPSPLLDVYINLPDGAAPESRPDRHAGNITLFGLNVASAADSRHGGNGLGYTLDITDLAKKLTEVGDFDSDHLRVTLIPGEQVTDKNPITIDKISVLRRSGIVN